MCIAFHFAGIAAKNVTLGVPRIKEIVDASKKLKTPQVTVYLQPPLCHNEELAEHFRETLPWTLLADLVSSSEIVWSPPDCLDGPDRELLELNEPLLPFAHTPIPGPSRYVLRFVLDQDILLDKGLEPVDVARCVQAYTLNNAEVIHSETNMQEWVIRVRLAHVLDMVSRIPDEADRKHTEKSIMQRKHQTFLNNVVICGIPGVTAAELKRAKWDTIGPGGELVSKEEWSLLVNGPVLDAVLQLDGVDTTRTISNNPMEVARIFGIEVAVNVLFHEIQKVLSFDGTYVNARHIMTLVNTMTHRDFIMPMNRHGINRVDFDLLLKASFEESVEILFEGASLKEQVSTKEAVSANVMLGQQVPLGTGSVTLMDPFTHREIRANARSSEVKTELKETLYSGYPVETQVGMDTDFTWYDDQLMAQRVEPVFRLVPAPDPRPLKKKRPSSNSSQSSSSSQQQPTATITSNVLPAPAVERTQEAYRNRVKQQYQRLGQFRPSSPVPEVTGNTFVPSSPPPDLVVTDQGVDSSSLQGLLAFVNRLTG